MVRYRSRSRSYSPRRSRSPVRRRRVDDRSRPSRSYRDRRSPAPSGLLVRNIALDARPEDLRVPFERFGPVKDVYLPKNYYTGEPRGFGFVKFRNAEDAAEAKHRLNHTVIGGREIAIVFAEENRKTPQEMRVTSRVSDRGRDRGGRDYYSPSRSRSVTRSVSPREDKRYRSNHNSKSPRQNEHSPHGKRDHGSDKRSSSPMKNGQSPRSPSPRENDHRKHSKKNQRSDQRSPSPSRRERSLSRPPSRSRSYSPR